MKSWKLMLGVNGMLLATLFLIAGPLQAPVSAQWPTEPYLSPCCKTAIEGKQFCCADCCGSGYRCSSTCQTKKT